MLECWNLKLPSSAYLGVTSLTDYGLFGALLGVSINLSGVSSRFQHSSIPAFQMGIRGAHWEWSGDWCDVVDNDPGEGVSPRRTLPTTLAVSYIGYP